MKKFFPVCIPLVFLLACDDSDQILHDQNLINSTPSFNKTLDEAVSIGIDAAERLFPNQSRVITHTASVKNVKTITSPNSRSGNKDTLLYIVNFDNEQGYAIIPAPNIDKNVLAVVENGYYDPEKGSDNPGFNYFIDAAISYTSNEKEIIKIDTTFQKPGPEIFHPSFDLKIDTIAHYQIKPRLEGIEWGQTGIYGAYCPNGVSGCLPTAIASIITYINKITNHQSNFTFSFPNNSFGTYPIDWNELFLHKRRYCEYKRANGSIVVQNQVCLESYSLSAHNLIGALMRQIGYDGDANYKSYEDVTKNNTSVADSKSQPLLEKYLPGHKVSKFKDFSFSAAQSSLNNCILLMKGQSSAGGHAWVADGYDQLDYHKYYAEWDFNSKSWNVITNRNYSDRLVHFCWGWDGVDDGYFEGEVFKAFDDTYRNTEFISVTVFNQ